MKSFAEKSKSKFSSENPVMVHWCNTWEIGVKKMGNWCKIWDIGKGHNSLNILQYCITPFFLIETEYLHIFIFSEKKYWNKIKSELCADKSTPSWYNDFSVVLLTLDLVSNSLTPDPAAYQGIWPLMLNNSFVNKQMCDNSVKIELCQIRLAC